MERKIKVNPDMVKDIPDEYKKSPYFDVIITLEKNYVEGVSTKTFLRNDGMERVIK